MAKSLDYIVYMTYDLHGQWDYGNHWASSGCSSGNCLRSHVNTTETSDALSMITKAGVPSNKIVVGVASYDRPFKMAEAGCTGPMCKFTGSPYESEAAKGRCTDTAGYISNAEIAEIVKSGHVSEQWVEAGSNIMVYNDTEWVAYMDDATKAARSAFMIGTILPAQRIGPSTCKIFESNWDCAHDNVSYRRLIMIVSSTLPTWSPAINLTARWTNSKSIQTPFRLTVWSCT